jgi:hypothetical protein
LLNEVNSSGAFLPATARQRSTTPVMMPGSAAGTITVNTAAPAWRRAPGRPRARVGTSSSSSSVVRAMIGIIIDAERKSAGQRAELAERQHGDAIGEHADHDRRHAVERVGGKPYQRREPVPGYSTGRCR